MYRFDPTFVQIVLVAVAMPCAGFLAAWAVIRGGEGTGEESGEGVGRGDGPGGSADRPLETGQRVMLWTAAGAAALFLLWWATLSTGSAGRPPL